MSNPIAYFFAHTDALGATLFCLLVAMSLASWYGIAGKALLFWRLRRDSRTFRRRLWQDGATVATTNARADDPFARLAQSSLLVHQDLLEEEGLAHDELLLRCMSRVVGEEGARLDNGQTMLASIAAVAPFIGLFGTVWGVHNALAAIGLDGATSLEQIAGPVGEALIMTALGLAVAIPAVLAYNVFARSSQMLLAELDALAHDLHHYLATGRALPASVRGV
jgi:biopolymer transport protein ExbB